MINLNDSSYDSNTVQIFNNGKAGIVENVKLDRIEKKTDDGNGPDYKLFFKDSAGNEINLGFWYLNSSKDTFQKDLEKQGKSIKHLLHCFYDSNFQFPIFENTQQLLDKTMQLLLQKSNTTTLRVYCTYGTTQYPKKYIQLRSYVPFIENQTIPLSETRLRSNSIDQLSKIEEDTITGSPLSSEELSNLI
jgi:hypothetical protein